MQWQGAVAVQVYSLRQHLELNLQPYLLARVNGLEATRSLPALPLPLQRHEKLSLTFNILSVFSYPHIRVHYLISKISI